MAAKVFIFFLLLLCFYSANTKSVNFEQTRDPRTNEATIKSHRSGRAIQQIPPDSIEGRKSVPNVVVMKAAPVAPPAVPAPVPVPVPAAPPAVPGARIASKKPTEDEFDKVESRAAAASGPAGIGVIPDTIDCYTPLLDLSTGIGEDNKLKLKYEYSDLPPCPIPQPEEDEPIPYNNYKGTRGYGEECRLHYEVHDEQIKGYSPAGGYMTTPNVFERTKEGSPDNTLDRKWNLINSYTCKREDFLECYPTTPDYTDEEGKLIIGNKGVCKCMAAFGRDVDERLVIQKKCYVPAGLGRHSECITEDLGSPLPSGDPLYEPKTWNSIKLPCTPDSTCVSHEFWIEKRCKCKKYFITDPVKGTCRDPNESKHEEEDTATASKSSISIVIISAILAFVLRDA